MGEQNDKATENLDTVCHLGRAVFVGWCLCWSARQTASDCQNKRHNHPQEFPVAHQGPNHIQRLCREALRCHLRVSFRLFSGGEKQRGRFRPKKAPSRARAATLFQLPEFKMKFYVAIALLCLTTNVEANTRSYSFPQTEDRIGTCLADGTSCGKIVADAFCKQQGFAESILFAREKTTSVRVLDSEARCEGESCEAFKKIKCFQPGDVVAR
jgi:hypothetical protein